MFYTNFFLLFILYIQTACQQPPCACNYTIIEKRCSELKSELKCKPQAQVFGGTKADLKKWPYIISLQLQIQVPGNDSGCYKHFCGGSLIAPNLVVSAAHCYDAFLPLGEKEGEPIVELPIYAAQAPVCRHQSNSLGKVDLRSQVTYIYQRPEWDRFNNVPNDDLAILVLNQSLPDPYVKLYSEFFDPDFDKPEIVTIAGCGNINHKETRDKNKYNVRNLYEAELASLKEDLCKILLDEMWPGASDRLNISTMVCAYDQDADSCKGDSGGPAVLKGASAGDDELVGVMSWGPLEQCTNETDGQAPGVFTRISAYKEWIDGIMEKYLMGVALRKSSGQFQIYLFPIQNYMYLLSKLIYYSCSHKNKTCKELQELR